MRMPRPACVLLACAILAGCATAPHSAVFEPGSQLQARSYQARSFATGDRISVLRAVIATLQDLGFVIDAADAELGAVSATRLDDGRLSVTVSVRTRDEAATTVRLNATDGLAAVTDPAAYQVFFAALSKAMFLEARAAY